MISRPSAPRVGGLTGKINRFSGADIPSESSLTSVFAPVVRSDPPRPGQDKEFVDFFKWVMETRLEVTDTPLQIWLPDLDTNQS